MATAMDTSTVASLLKCSICIDLPTGQIQACKNGHNICASHMSRLHPPQCPECRVSYSCGSSRNLLAEALVAEERARRQRQQEQNELEERQQRQRGREQKESEERQQRQRQQEQKDLEQRLQQIVDRNHGYGRAAVQSTSTSGVVSAGRGAVQSTTTSGVVSGIQSQHQPGGACGTTSRLSASNLRNDYPIQTMIPCAFIKDGCDEYRNSDDSVQQHEEYCHFRPIRCCLSTNACYNTVLPFFDYVSHLQEVHGVKYYQGSHHAHNYTVKAKGGQKKMIRDGSSSLFILEVANQVFLVRGIEIHDRIYIWVAYHGHPDNGRLYRAEIEFNFQEDEPLLLHGSNQARYVQDGPRPGRVDYASRPFSHCGNVLATTRQMWDEISYTGNYFTMEKFDVEDFLKRGAVFERSQREETWAINISITRPGPIQPGN